MDRCWPSVAILAQVFWTGPARGTALGHGAMAMMYPGQLFFVIPVEMVPAGGWAAFSSDPPYTSEVFAHQGWAAISSDTPYPSEVSAHQGWAAFSSDTPYPSEVSAHQGWAAFNSDTPYPSEESARCSTTTELNPAAAQLNPSAKPFVPSLKKKASTLLQQQQQPLYPQAQKHLQHLQQQQHQQQHAQQQLQPRLQPERLQAHGQPSSWPENKQGLARAGKKRKHSPSPGKDSASSTESQVPPVAGQTRPAKLGRLGTAASSWGRLPAAAAAAVTSKAAAHGPVMYYIGDSPEQYFIGDSDVEV